MGEEAPELLLASAQPAPPSTTRRRRLSASTRSKEPRADATTPSQPATAAAAADAVRATASTLVKLLHLDDLPAWQQDNHFILSGYRPESGSYVGSVRSVFAYVHNESVNIWTHLAGAVLFPLFGAFLWAAAAPRYATADAGDAAAFACFFAGALVCLGLSAACHTLANHSREVARWGHKLDYLGIVALILGSYMPALYYGFYCHRALMRRYVAVIISLGACCMVVTWLERFRTPRWRPYRAAMYVALGLSGIVPIVHGVELYGYQGMEQRMGLSWVILQGGLYIFGAFLYASQWPERSFPHTFDLFGSSHQIFHVCVLAAAASFLYGMTKAFDFHHSVMGAQCLV